ncbi:hypothetical protein MMC06_004896 [Schaereria dolodes]|nr:hypothetical protein [Schaereria dolodes]
MFSTLHTSVLPLISEKYAPNLRIVFRQQIQPWHPSSTLTHEAAAAVLRLAPVRFYDFSALLFKHQKEYFDVSVVRESRNETYRRLAKLAGNVGLDEGEVYRLLEVSEEPGEGGSLNVGNGVTDDVKLMVKTNRLAGASVHVTPTVVFNGVVESSISSSFTGKQWEEWLDKNIV